MSQAARPNISAISSRVGDGRTLNRRHIFILVSRLAQFPEHVGQIVHVIRNHFLNLMALFISLLHDSLDTVFAIYFGKFVFE